MSAAMSAAMTAHLNPAHATISASRSAPMLMNSLSHDSPTHKVLGTIAKTYGATIKDTLHKRGEHEVGAVKDQNGDDVYVPRALWTESHDSPMTLGSRVFDKQQFVAAELKRVANEHRKKDYYRKVVDHQLTKGVNLRSTMRDEKKEFASLVKADTDKHLGETTRFREQQAEGRQQFKEALDKQVGEQNLKVKENLRQDAQEGIQMKVMTMKHLSQEMEKHARLKKHAHKELISGMQEIETKRLEQRAAKERENEEARRAIREQLEQDEYRLAATAERLKGAQKQQNEHCKLYERTAGKTNRERAQAEENRLNRDEHMHLLRTDTYYANREMARERQRAAVVAEMDKHRDANERQKDIQRLVKEADREAVLASTKLAYEQDLEKHRKKKAEELQLQHDLLVMIAEKEKREQAEGTVRVPAASTMSFSKIGGMPADLARRVDAARYVSKPLGRSEGRSTKQVVPVDASPSSMRRQLAKSHSAPTGSPGNAAGIGGVVGVLNGGGGPVSVALAATGGQEHFLTKATGLAVRDRQLSSSWNEGLRPKDLRAARKVAAQREADKALANHD